MRKRTIGRLDHLLSVRLRDAANPNIAPERIKALVLDASPEVRRWVAEHQDLTGDEERLLGADADPAVRVAIARYRLLDERLRAALADDQNESVRAAVRARDLDPYFRNENSAESNDAPASGM